MKIFRIILTNEYAAYRYDSGTDVPNFPRLLLYLCSAVFFCYYLRFNKYVYCASDTLVKCYVPSSSLISIMMSLPKLIRPMTIWAVKSL